MLKKILLTGLLFFSNITISAPLKEDVYFLPEIICAAIAWYNLPHRSNDNIVSQICRAGGQTGIATGISGLIRDQGANQIKNLSLVAGVVGVIAGNFFTKNTIEYRCHCCIQDISESIRPIVIYGIVRSGFNSKFASRSDRKKRAVQELVAYTGVLVISEFIKEKIKLSKK